MKLNVLLAKTEHSASQFKKLIKEYKEYFKNKQGDFKGIRKTYTPRPDTVDLPSERGIIKVVTTVDEKLQWLTESSADYINNLFSVEATNASGNAKAELKVEGISLGTYSSLELLRLKSLLETSEFEEMYATIPVRSDAETWTPSSDELYEGREVFEQPILSGIKRSLTKESYIIQDPNVQYLKDTSKYQPQVATKDTILELGDYTIQGFSGEFTHRQRAQILRRRSQLLDAVIEALKVANDAEQVPSAMTAQKLFTFLHDGTVVA